MPEQLPENLFDVVVRVTFDVDASEVEDWEGRHREWDVYGVSTLENVSTVSMEMVVEVPASTPEEAVQEAIHVASDEEQYPLGTNIAVENAKYWVDESLEDSVKHSKESPDEA